MPSDANIPKSVIKQSHAIVREHPRMRLKRGGADSTKGVAKAIAWKHFCKEHPGSDHCHKKYEGEDAVIFSSWNPLLEGLADDLEALSGIDLLNALREAGETANQMAHGFFQKRSGEVFKQNAAADKAKGSASSQMRAHKSAVKVNAGAKKDLSAIAKQAAKEKDKDTAKWAKGAAGYHDQRVTHHTGVAAGIGKTGAAKKPMAGLQARLQAKKAAKTQAPAAGAAPAAAASAPKPAAAAPAAAAPAAKPVKKKPAVPAAPAAPAAPQPKQPFPLARD